MDTIEDYKKSLAVLEMLREQKVGNNQYLCVLAVTLDFYLISFFNSKQFNQLLLPILSPLIIKGSTISLP